MPNSNNADYMFKISADTSEFNKQIDDAGKKADNFADRLTRARNNWNKKWREDLSLSASMASVNKSLEEQKKYVADIQAKYQEMYNLSGKMGQTTKTLNAEMQSVSKSISDATKNMSVLTKETSTADDRIKKILDEMSESKSFSEGAKAIVADIKRVEEEMNALGKERFETKAHADLVKNIEDAQAALDKLIERQKKMDAIGVKESSREYRSLVYDIDKARQKVADLEAEEDRMERSGEAFTFGTDTEAYKAKEEELQHLNEKLEAYYEDYKRLNDIIAKAVGTDTTEEVEKAAERATETISEMQNRIKSGTQAIADDVKRVSEEFANMATSEEDTGVEEISDRVEEANKRVSMLGALLQRLKIPDDIADSVDEATEKTGIFASLWQRLTLGSGAFSEEAREIRDEIDEIRQSMADLAGAQVETDEYAELSQSIRRAEAALIDLYDKQIRMEDTGVKETSSAWKNLQYDIQQTERQLNDFKVQQEQMRESGEAFVSGADTQVYEQLNEELDGLLERLEEVSREGGSAIGRLGSAVKNSLVKDVRAGVSAFGKAMSTGIKNIQNGVKGFINHIKQMRKETKGLDDVVKKVSKTFTSFLALLKTRVKRMAISEVFKDLKENTGIVAQMSECFNKAISDMILSCKQLGLQIVAAVEPLVAVAGPYITQFIDMLTAGADKMAQFMARLTGNQTYLKAEKGQYDYAASLDKTAKSTEKATKATKEYQNTVLSFDQLHKLNGNDSDVSVDDAEAITGVSDRALKQAETQATALNEIADRIREAIKAGNFREAGKVVGEAVTGAFSWLSDVAGWEKNGEKFSKNIQKVIDFINGIPEGLDGEKIGRSVGDVVNTVINGFGMLVDPENGIDFHSWGVTVGEAIVAAVKEINWYQLGQDFIGAIQGVVNFVRGVIEQPDFFSSLGDALHDVLVGFVDGITEDDWIDTITRLINGFFEFLGHAFGDLEKAKEFGEKVANIINGVFDGLDADTITSGANALIQTLTTAINTILTNLHWGDILGKLGEILVGLDWVGLGEIVAIAAAPAMGAAFVKHLGAVLFGGSGAGAAGGAGLLGGLFGTAAISAPLAIGGGALGVNAAGALGLMSGEQVSEYNSDPIGNFFESLTSLVTKSPIAAIWDEDVRGMYFSSGEKADEQADNVASMSDMMNSMSEDIRSQLQHQTEAGVTTDALTEATEGLADVYETTAADMKAEGTTNTNLMIDALKELGIDLQGTIQEYAQRDTGDIVLTVDGEELARAATRGQYGLDKRLNPQVSFG